MNGDAYNIVIYIEPMSHNQPILTRYLYNRDEVVHSLVVCLLDKSSFKEALFWSSELYYSGYEEILWTCLWKIFYDFFALRNPTFERKIARLHRKWLKYPIPEPIPEPIIATVNLLYHCSTSTYKVFCLRIMNAPLPHTIYRGRLPTWLKKLNLTKKERYIIRAIEGKDITNISYYLSLMEYDIPRCYQIIRLWFENKTKQSLKEISLDDIPYGNKKHIIYALICYLMMETSEEIASIRKIALVRILEQESIDFFKGTNVAVQPVWKTLAKRRLYAIRDCIGIFPNVRKDHTDDTLMWKEILWYHWEYYAQKCPLWRERFVEYKCLFDKEKKIPLFPNDDILEAFYEKYGMEPDEQSRECQYKSLTEIKQQTVQEWLETHFDYKEENTDEFSAKVESYLLD